ncbi:site-specific integrase [Pedobacter frigidisoli]|uniref:Site-specific integrase n=1 Tax=Pedobacter frigidisoli TaxID=2530455 RepID=A0A4R0P428_9SPHI|nr:site-specific integrase [Pedobacter frigidisoli]TCD11614.1 site-specific integrase [Pedobacter frigidisoli]
MSAKFSLLFFLKRRGGYVGGDLPVYLRITVDGKRAELAIQRKCDPEKWNTKKGCMVGTKDSVKEFNSFLLAFQTKVYEIQRSLLMDGNPIDPEIIKRNLTGKDRSAKMFLEVFEEHNENMRKLVGKDYSLATLTKYSTCLKSLKLFVQFQYKTSDINIRLMDFAFLTSLEMYLKTQKGVGHNTAMGYVKKVKKIIHFCVANKWLASDPFMAFKVSINKTSRTFLSEAEMKSLTNKEFKIQRLAEVRDMFLFSCYTGLAYVDVAKLTNNAIVEDGNATTWIVMDRTKTGVMANIPLLPQAEKIIDKYKDHPKVLVTGKLLPMISNQKVNAYLKEISVLCGITKELSHHCARHTFATTVTLSNGVPIETVSKMLGHSSLKSTQHYAKVLDKKVASDMKRLIGVL